jgi:hypothetical protein
VVVENVSNQCIDWSCMNFGENYEFYMFKLQVV